MFRGLINDAKSAAGAVVAKYAARVSVAVPFLVALGFATAAAVLMLTERFGAMTAYWIMAGGFTALGLVAALVVGLKEQEEEIAEAVAEKTDTADVATDAAAQAAVQMPIALLGTLLSSPAGRCRSPGLRQMVGRNLPLVVAAGAHRPDVLAFVRHAARSRRRWNQGRTSAAARTAINRRRPGGTESTATPHAT